MTNTVETKLSDFVCSYLWFLAISLMKEDASHQRVHTPDLQKWDGWHAEILNNLWLEKWECCVSRASYKFHGQHGVTSWCAPIFHMNWQILSSVYKYLASLGKANMKNKFQKTPLELSLLFWGLCFLQMKSERIYFVNMLSKTLSKKGGNNWGAEKLHTLAWKCLATAPSELGATEKKADEMLKRQTMKC